MGKQVEELRGLLQASLAQTLGVLAVLSDAELDDHSDHPCAMGGSVRDLLTHNIDHERMHTGQVFSARYSQRKMQNSEVDRLMAEALKARTDLIASLIGLPDDALEARMPDEQWTIREMIEHTIYWERHSVDELARTQLAGRAPAAGPEPLDVRDPIYGQLAGAQAS
ncbi:MAG: DinB family protein [Anaerolineales bacterium]